MNEWKQVRYKEWIISKDEWIPWHEIDLGKPIGMKININSLGTVEPIVMKELILDFEVEGIGHKIKLNVFAQEITFEQIMSNVNKFFKNNIRMDMYLMRMMFDYHTCYCLNALKMEYNDYIQLVAITSV